MRRISLLLVVMSLIGCAGTYAPPVTREHLTATTVGATKTDIFRTAQQVLVTEGYQITNADEMAGTISTAPRNLRVTPLEVDCGTTMGLDYLKDVRTSTRVAVGLVIGEGTLTAKANIEGEYKPGSAIQNITLTCVSRGVIEQALVEKINAAIGMR